MLYKRYVVKTKLIWLLKDITPPANTTTMDIRATTMKLPPTRTTDDVAFALGQYITTEDLDAVKHHYLVEFPRHKFIYKREARQHNGDVDITFCRTGYVATLNLTSNPEIKGMKIYTIFLVKSGGNPC